LAEVSSWDGLVDDGQNMIQGQLSRGIAEANFVFLFEWALDWLSLEVSGFEDEEPALRHVPNELGLIECEAQALNHCLLYVFLDFVLEIPLPRIGLADNREVDDFPSQPKDIVKVQAEVTLIETRMDLLYVVVVASGDNYRIF
jgi:hypothetical protein